MDQKALHKFSYGVYIVSSCHEGKQSGCVVNTLSQVTSNPIKLSVTISKNNFTEEIIEKSGYFAAITLAQTAPMDLIGEFGFKSSKNIDKFAKFHTKTDINGIKYVTDFAASMYSCKVINSFDLGTHVMFIGEILDSKVLSDQEVMTYSYYHKIKKGATPKNAPSYIEEPPKKGYRCTVCGYILESHTIPNDFICPICGVDRDKFIKL
ncbi:flavin reductase [Clostridium rectalis]|uniref:flavin reductase n=1 Tax=Clostridium rectalis TaxID=2040295 RepID=UPI000F63A5AC|nr:flavin reductase [Clostridium rectalis]